MKTNILTTISSWSPVLEDFDLASFFGSFPAFSELFLALFMATIFLLWWCLECTESLNQIADLRVSFLAWKDNNTRHARDKLQEELLRTGSRPRQTRLRISISRPWLRLPGYWRHDWEERGGRPALRVSWLSGHWTVYGTERPSALRAKRFTPHTRNIKQRM